MPFARRFLVFFSVTAVSMLLDQVTKHLATNALKGRPMTSYWGDLFRLQYATNEGAFLSLGASLPSDARYWILTIGVGALLLALSVFALTSKKLDAFGVFAYALIASGGLSNWVDRARFSGRVVDFMNLGLGPVRTGIFNVADLAIMVGIGLLFLEGWRQEKRAKARASHAPSQTPPTS